MIGAEFARVLADAQSGDPHAIETIYRDTAPLVIGYLTSNGAFEPEDITSEVFVAMIRSISTFEGDETHFRSWLLTIAHRRLIDAIRRYGRRREDPQPTLTLTDQKVVSHDTEIEALARLRSRGVLEMIDRLTEDQRAVLLLRVLADLTINDIANIVGKPETAVKALLRRALASLARMDDEGGGDRDAGPAAEEDRKTSPERRLPS